MTRLHPADIAVERLGAILRIEAGDMGGECAFLEHAGHLRQREEGLERGREREFAAVVPIVERGGGRTGGVGLMVDRAEQVPLERVPHGQSEGPVKMGDSTPQRSYAAGTKALSARVAASG